MKPLSPFTKPLGVLLILTVLVFFACTNSRVVTKKNQNITKLHTLWVDQATFHSWVGKGRLMLRFTFTKGNITLAGWFNKPGTEDYNHDPDAVLNVLKQSHSLKPDPLYLGNLRLTADEITAIDGMAKPGNTILFVPVISPDAATNGNIRYEIYISTSPPKNGEVSIMSITNTGIKADPSPPATR